MKSHKQKWLSYRIAVIMIAFIISCSVGATARAELPQMVDISASDTLTCALTSTGGVGCWGYAEFEFLAYWFLRESASVMAGATSGIAKIATGYDHVCLLTTAGGVKCWGSDSSNQIPGFGGNYTEVAVDIAALSTGVFSLASGQNHSCAITTLGSVKCWGANGSGQLGDGTIGTIRALPVDVSGLSAGAVTIAAGERHNCAVMTSGGVKCWGRNADGQLGDNSTTIRATPVDVSGLTVGVSSVSAARYHTCAVTTAGGVKCWGRNSSSQLGDGTTADRLTPVDVTGLTSGVSKVATGGYHSCALLSSGGVKCWGNNYYLSLGNVVMDSSAVPIDVFVASIPDASAISAGAAHTCITNTGGEVKCWGVRYNPGSLNLLGDGSSGKRVTPVDVSGLTTGVVGIALGGKHTCAVTSTGGAKCWGYNTPGHVGDGSTIDRLTAVDVFGQTVGVSAIAAGGWHSCSLTTAGGVKCWGGNSDGQLGDSSTTDRTAAVNVTGLTSAVDSITTGGRHTCAVTTAGAAKCWGYNNKGQLGDNSTTQRTAAVDVSGLAGGVGMLAAGDSHTCAVTTTGGAKCWGLNDSGQVGDGSVLQRNTPVDVTGLAAGVTSITAGFSHTCALTTAGGVKCWGANINGQLGDGSGSQQTTAVDVVGHSSGVSFISAGSYHTCAVTTSGGAKCWGKNSSAQLGDSTLTDRATAVDVLAHTSGVVAVVAGGSHSCALLTAGGARCWGSSTVGQLGDEFEASLRTVRWGLNASGIVRESGSPLSGVTIRATGMGPLFASQEVTSDGSGAFQLPIVESAAYTITPELSGYSFAPSSITGTMAEDFNQDFVATLITYNISGTVTAGGNPLAGATIDGGALGTTTTDVDGDYAFNLVLPSTAYTITVSHSGATFGVNSASGTLTGHATHDFSGTLNTYNISGTVLVGGAPLSGVAVDGGALGTAMSDINGAYTFAGVTYGTAYTLTPSLVDYSFTPTSVTGTVTGNHTLDFVGAYSPPSTTSIATTSVATTSSVVTTTMSAATTTAPISSTTTISAVTVPTTILSTTAPITSSASTTTIGQSSTTSTPPADTDTDGDGVADTDEIATGTNPLDPGSRAPKLRTTICSDWNGYLAGPNGSGMYNIMEHINLTAKKIRVKTELRSIRGHLKDTYEFFLRGYQQFDLLVHDMAGREINSYGQVCTSYQRAPEGSVDGHMVYYRFGAGREAPFDFRDNVAAKSSSEIQFAFALPFENPVLGDSSIIFNTMQPSLAQEDSGNLVANWLQLSNVSKKRLKGKLYFHALDGSDLGSPLDVNLRDGARYDYSAHAYGANRAGLVRFVPQDANVEYQFRQVRYMYDNAGSVDSFATAYPFSAMVGNGEQLFAPVDTNGQAAVLELANTLPKKVSVALSVYDKSGKKLVYSKSHSLKSHSSLHLPLESILVNTTGMISAKSSHAASIVAGVVHYTRNADGSIRNMYNIPMKEPIGAVLTGSYNTYLNQGCTLYLVNSSLAKRKLLLSFSQSDGSSIRDYSLTVPSRGAVAEDICSNIEKNHYGAVKVSTDAKGIYGIMVRRGDADRYRIATVLR